MKNDHFKWDHLAIPINTAFAACFTLRIQKVSCTYTVFDCVKKIFLKVFKMKFILMLICTYTYVLDNTECWMVLIYFQMSYNSEYKSMTWSVKSHLSKGSM